LRRTKMKYYAGIGSRQTSPEIMELMKEIASILEKQGWTLRSGAAQGADSAFASGVEKNAEIWIPWESFGAPHNPNHTYKVIQYNDAEANKSVDQFHPSPKSLSSAARKLMSRNYRQIVGLDSPNSKFVICWTPNGERKGGTSQAWSIADHYNIPVFNLAIDEDFEKILKWKDMKKETKSHCALDNCWVESAI